jgi:broad specificity phosphatase PhoE
MLLYCVRHGESTYNAEGRIQGQSDVPLSDLGRRQGAAVAEDLAGRRIDALYASPLRRAWETAEIIARRLRLEVQLDARLQEIHAGIFQDRTRAELQVQCPDALARWIAGDPDFVIPGGESRQQLVRRGCEVFRAIAAAGHQQALIVSHGRLLAVTIKALTDFSVGEATPSLENGSITTLAAHSDGRFEVLAFNQVHHLQPVGLAGKGDL